VNRPAKFIPAQIKLLCLLYLGYAVSMIMKTSIIVVSPSLISDPSIAMTKTQFGEILAYGSVGGIFGKILFGWSTDKYGGKLNFLFGLLALSIGVFVFGFSHQFIAFSAMFACISMSKSGGWPSFAKLTSNWYHPSQYGRVWGYISTASRTGTIVATVGLGFLLSILPWRQVLYVAGSIGILMVLTWLFLVKEAPVTAQTDGQEAHPGPERYSDHSLQGKSLKFALLDFLTSKRVWLIFLAMMGLTILMDFLYFVPIFLKETLNLSDSDAVMTASAFPVGAFVSVLIGGHVFDSLPAKAVTRILGGFLSIAVLCIAVVLNLPHLGLSSSSTIYVVYVCLFGFGFSISPAYYLPMSIFSIKYGGPYSGALISILDLGGFFAGGLFAIGSGILADMEMGWNKVLTLILVVGIVTLFLTVWFLHNESKIHGSRS
jgi:OPA family sugar phosphate sensor protein UhpC-like MFS transporter